MATIEDILNAVRGLGYADGSTWMQQPQTQAEGPAMPSQGGAVNADPIQNRRHFPPEISPEQMDMERRVYAQNMRPDMGAQILPPFFTQANFGQVQPQQPAMPMPPSGMIGWRALAPKTLADLAPNAPGLGAAILASNRFVR